MRIERLDLIAYGAFDGHSLHDLGAPGVHLVHGPNEAGKSTALSALDQLLYGIDHNSPYAFLHRARTRLGARLSTADGVALEIVRRKKRKDALVDGDGTPIGQDALAPFLGGIDRDTFTTEFALNSDELRRGGKLLSSGEGDMAQMLAAARSGMRLKAVLDTIESRQDRLFRVRGRTNPRINVALGRLKELRLTAREATLQPGQYRGAEQAAAEAGANLVAAEKELKRVQVLREDKQRLLGILPLLDEQRDLEDQIAEITARGPSAPDDIREQLGDLLREQSNHHAVCSKNAPLVEDIDQRLATTGDDGSPLPNAAAIERLSKEITAILDAVTQRDESSGKAARTRNEAESRLRTVHPRATLTDEHLYRLPAALRTTGQNLRDEGRKRHEALDRARDTVERHREKSERLGKELSSLPASEDVTPLKNAYIAVPHDLPDKLTSTQATEKKCAQRFQQTLNRLDLPELPPEDVLNLRLPELGRVTEAEAGHRELDKGHSERAAELDQTQRRLATYRRKLARLVTGDAPPTRDDLRAHRALRDDLITRFRDDPDAEAPLQEAVRRADTTVDLMLQHAEEVNKRAETEREIAELESAVPELQAAVEEAHTDLTQARQSWDALWDGFPAPSPEPGRGTGVLDAVDRLKTEAQDLQDVRIDLREQRDRLQAHTARLKDLLRLGDAPPSTDAAVLFTEVLSTAGARLDEHDAAAAKRAVAQRDLDNAEAELADAEAAETRAAKDVEEHGEQWRRFLGDAGLPADRDFDTALTELNVLFQVAGEVDAATAIEDALRQAEKRISDFEGLLRETLRSCGRSVPTSTIGWHQAIETLERDLQRQRDDDRTRQGLLDHKSNLDKQIEDASHELKEIESRLQDFRARLGVSTIAEMEDAVGRARDLREKSTALANIQRALPSGAELARLRGHGTSADKLTAELVELDQRISELEETRDRWLEQRTTRRDAFARLNGGEDAARVTADIAATCAELAEDAEEFLRLEAARVALLACMDEYRNSDQEPVLAQASEMFAKLSLGRYTGLELSDEERPSIRAKSSTGTLPPTALSEGTRDQLYLALRLATLERHAAAGNALPIAVDDIFMTFDEQRTEAALHVLDTMADRFQIIVFTHHEHVIRSAAKQLPKDHCHVHHLPRSQPG
ncbi:YhaN family protein [Actinomadura sp. 6K520]|uniref:YhaN family protein n=1 Tax=Actinomadura sp. 6K520 TaxID=2530364 RepID=UPI001FB71809|nr:YhaN family protein [Actinomadura sp. 6K520]